MKLKSTLLVLASLLIGLTSCSDSSNSDSLTQEELSALSKLDTIKITLETGDRMIFDKTDITVFEGQAVVVTLHHTGTMAKSSMGHNFVLLEQDVSVKDFAYAVADQKVNEYLPADKKGVIAHTGLIGGGEITSVTFQAPKKGTYDFLCSFPGHSSTMKGKFHVK